MRRPSRRRIVAGEVVTGARAHHVEDALEHRLVVFVDLRFGDGTDQRCQPFLVARQVDEAGRQFAHRQHHVGHLGRDHRPRHALVRRFPRVLHQHQAARLLDRLGAHRAVRAAARQDHRESVAVVFGQRAEEEIDRGAPFPIVVERGRGDRGFADSQAAIGRDYVHGIRLQIECLAVVHLDHVHSRAPGQDARQLAFMIRRQVHHHHEGEAEVGGQRVEELAQRLDASGGGADAHNGQSRRGLGAAGGAAFLCHGGWVSCGAYDITRLCGQRL
jgi:hypothetical protein